MGKIVLFLFGILIIAKSGYSLVCYTCNTGTNNECKNFTPERSALPCGLPHEDFVQFCMFKSIYDRQESREIVAATCETARRPEHFNLDTFEREQCQFGARYGVNECRICLNDLCNYPTKY